MVYSSLGPVLLSFGTPSPIIFTPGGIGPSSFLNSATFIASTV
ncbi:hypothetical protein [Clostridium tagluense]|nr:hypothetical protein [Clostridium tagluense]